MKIGKMKISPMYLVIGLVMIALIGMTIFNKNPIGAIKAFAVTGVGDITYPGDTFEHNFQLTNYYIDKTLPELDASDDEVNRLYKAFRMVDQAGNTVQEGFEEVTVAVAPGGTVSYPISLVVSDATPSGDYAVAAMLFDVKQTLDRTTNTWTTGTPSIIDKLALEFNVQTPTAPPSIGASAIQNMIGDLFASIWNWIRSLFGWA